VNIFLLVCDIIKVSGTTGISRKGALFMTYKELKKAYEEAAKKCSVTANQNQPMTK
jgi:hypothetical protein